MIKNIIFDFGGVLMDLSKKHTLSIPHVLVEIFDIDTQQADQIWRENKDDLLIGKESLREFLERLKKSLKSEKTIDELHEMFKYLHSLESEHINWELVDLIRELKNKYKLY